MRGTLISDGRCLAHDTGPGHPESPRWIEAVLQRLRTRRDLSDLLDRRVSVPAGDSDVLGVHSFLQARERAHGCGYSTKLGPVACRFRPDRFVVSAGFDAHMTDSLGRQLLRTRSLALLSRRVRRLAADLRDSRVVLTLEGGYGLPTLTDCVEVCLWELCGERAYITDTPPKPDATPASAAAVTAARGRVRMLWDI